MTTTDTLDLLRRLRVLPVIVIDDAARAVPLARALAEGGLPAAEVTFRTAGAAEAIRRIAAEVPEVALGAGTVLTPERVNEARDAGATFIVAPGFNPAVVDRAQELGLAVFPGVATPTEVEMALGRGLTTVKFFPAEPMGGVAFLKAMCAPYGMMRFMPTGGVGPANLRDYLQLKQVVACGGSWMAPSDRIAAGDWAWIAAETRKAAELAGANANTHAGTPSTAAR
jgi:2-dehydro-3-deoxyphosphogluconate aldolase / (4S)-4-hydroxy-2-oxoglutarate aldolase